MYKSLFAALVLAAGTSSAFAASIVVDSNADTGDATPGDGVCGTGLPGSSCTLRAAIQEANGTPASDTITFGLSGTTSVLTALPPVTQPLVIDGDGHTVDGNGLASLFIYPDTAAAGHYELRDLTLTGGSAASADGGGAVFFEPVAQVTFTVSNVVVNGNEATAGPGGGLALNVLHNSTVVTLDLVEISGNTATGAGGGVWVNVGGTGSVTLNEVTIAGNTAGDGGNGHGGGLHVTGGRVVVDSSTISGNTASGTGEGDGIYLAAGGNVLLENSTLSGNAGDGIAVAAGNTAASWVTFTTITGNTGAGIRAATPATNFPGNLMNPFTSNIVVGNGTNCTTAFAHNDTANSGFNLTNGAGCGFTQASDKVVAAAADAKLAALSANPDARLQTHALTAGSPAIDAGNSAWATPADQRDANSQDGGAADGIPGDDTPVRDIGAYEYGGFGLIQFSLANFPVDEDNGPALVLIKRYGTGTAAATTPTVAYSTSTSAGAGRATQGACSDNANDYTAVAGPITANPMNFGFTDSGATQFERTASMTICNDTTASEPAETFDIALADPSGGDTVGFDFGPLQTGTVTITDVENGQFQFNPLAYSAAEGNVGSNGSVTLTITRTGGTGGAVRVNYATRTGADCDGPDCTATEGTDYTAASTFVDFANGEASKTITINFVGDAAYENGANETFEVTLGSVACQGLAAGRTCDARLGAAANQIADVTINNDDTAQPGTLQFAAATYTAQETGGTLTVTVKRVGGSDGAVTVTYDATDMSATEGPTGDYYLDLVDPGPYTLSWGANVGGDQTFTVNLVDDANTVESNKRFKLTLDAPTGGATIDPTLKETVVTIVSNEQPAFQFADTTLEVAEGSTVQPQVSWTTFTGDPVTVTYETANGTAVAPGDFLAVGPTVLTIPATESSPRTLAGISATAGDAAEGNETFNVVLSAPTNGAQIGTGNPAVVTIVDPPGVRFTGASFTRANEQNAQAITVVAERIGDTSQALSVDFAISQDCATPPCATQGSDYTRSGGFTGTLSWTAGETATKSFDISVIGDTVIEGDEGIKVTLSNARTGAAPGVAAAIGGTNPATAVIPDDDYRFEIVETSPLTVSEGAGTATVTVRRFGSTLGAATVNYATANDTASAPGDFTAASGTLTWATGVGGTQTVNVTIAEDGVDEANEAFTFALSTPSSNASGEASAISGSPLTVQITDNDTAGVTVTQSGGTTAATEGGATDQYTLVLTSQPAADVVITPSGDSQLSVSPATLTFTTANWNVAQVVTVTAVNDAVAEGAHNGTVTHAATGDAAYAGMAIASVTVAITDNDTAGVTVTQSGGATAVAEAGATDTYTIVLNTQPTASVTIAVTGDADVGGAPTPLTFTTANWNVAQTVTVTAVNDAQAEGPHTGVLTHAATSGDTRYQGIAIAAVTATITDNDTGGITVTQSGGSTAVAEGGATDTLTVVLASQPTATVTITAAAGSQLTATPATLTFTTVNWNVPQTVSIGAVDDGNVEGAHSANLGGTATSADPAYNGALSTITVAIADNDTDQAPPGAIVVTPSGNVASPSEGGGGSLTWTALLGMLGLAGLRRRGLAAVVLSLLAAPVLAQTGTQAAKPATKPSSKAGLSYNTVDLRYLVVSVDEPSVDASGFALAGSWAMNKNMFVTASYGTVETDDLRISGVTGSSQTDTLAVGIGGHYPISKVADLVGAFNILSASAEGQGGFSGSTDDTGWGFEAGVRGLWDPKVEWSAAISYVTIFEDDDTALALQTQYRLNRNWGVLAGVGLGSNAQQLNFGARYNF